VGGSVTGAPLEPRGKAELEEAGGRRREGVLKANGGGDGGSRQRVTIMMWWAMGRVTCLGSRVTHCMIF
jgi:hypothetical protein